MENSDVLVYETLTFHALYIFPRLVHSVAVAIAA